MKPILKLFLFIALLALTACNKTTPIDEIEGFDYGTVTKDHYINKFFKIEMDIPKGWNIQDENQRKELMKQGSKVVFKDSINADAVMEASKITTANLFTAITNDPNATVFRENILLMAENIQQHPFVKTGDIYLENVNKILSNSNLKIVQIDHSFPKKVINGKTFYEMNIIAHIQDLDVHQTYLATIEKGFALCIIYSYINDDQKAELEKYVNTFSALKKQ